MKFVNALGDGVPESARQALAVEEEEYAVMRLAVEMLGISNSLILERKQKKIDGWKEYIRQHSGVGADNNTSRRKPPEIQPFSKWVQPGMFRDCERLSEAILKYLNRRYEEDGEIKKVNIYKELWPDLRFGEAHSPGSPPDQLTLGRIMGSIRQAKSKGRAPLDFREVEPTRSLSKGHKPDISFVWLTTPPVSEE
jgi:hypothetical protein